MNQFYSLSFYTLLGTEGGGLWQHLFLSPSWTPAGTAQQQSCCCLYQLWQWLPICCGVAVTGKNVIDLFQSLNSIADPSRTSVLSKFQRECTLFFFLCLLNKLSILKLSSNLRLESMPQSLMSDFTIRILKITDLLNWQINSQLFGWLVANQDIFFLIK